MISDWEGDSIIKKSYFMQHFDLLLVVVAKVIDSLLYCCPNFRYIGQTAHFFISDLNEQKMSSIS